MGGGTKMFPTSREGGRKLTHTLGKGGVWKWFEINPVNFYKDSSPRSMFLSSTSFYHI